MADLEDIIEDSISDAALPPEPVETEAEPTPEVAPEAPPEAPEAPTESDQVESPAMKAEKAEAAAKALPDDFEKKFGIPSQSAGGRENRIPYSRVTKIVDKAVKTAIADRNKEFETTYNPKLADFEAKVKDYEGKLERVAEFEKVMVNKPDQFLKMLSQIPAYADFFKAIEAGFKEQAAPAAEAPIQSDAVVGGSMPVPDQELPDGSKVYSLDGLKALLMWNSNQTRTDTIKEVEKRYAPIESDWQANKKVQAMIPQVQAQITDARTWPMFTENEDDIVKALQTNQQLSLEGAYRQVVWPKMTADRNKMREEILKEVKQAPRATAAPTQASRSSVKEVPTGPRNLEDIIAEAAATLK